MRLIYGMLTQFWNPLEMQIFDLYIPNEDERSNPDLYAANVGKFIAEKLDIPYIDGSGYSYSKLVSDILIDNKVSIDQIDSEVAKLDLIQERQKQDRKENGIELKEQQDKLKTLFPELYGIAFLIINIYVSGHFMLIKSNVRVLVLFLKFAIPARRALLKMAQRQLKQLPQREEAEKPKLQQATQIDKTTSPSPGRISQQNLQDLRITSPTRSSNQQGYLNQPDVRIISPSKGKNPSTTQLEQITSPTAQKLHNYQNDKN
ncbi:MAG: hypothetical protein EZS28_044487, partial [Streblomastix strix]